ncbi:hypothetical protein D3C84_459040 [compost metagenome]
MVAVETDFGPGVQSRTQGPDLLRHFIGQHVAGRVGAVDAIGAVAFHQARLLQQLLRADHVRHHQEADGVQAHLRRHADVLAGHVRLGAVGRHTNGRHAVFVGHLQVVEGTDPRQQQGRNLGLFHLRDHRGEVLLVTVGRETVVQRRTAQAIAVGDFDQRHTGRIETGGHRDHLFDTDLVLFGVHAVAQAHVVQTDALTLQIHRDSPLNGRAVAGRPCGLLRRTSRPCANRRRS